MHGRPIIRPALTAVVVFAVFATVAPTPSLLAATWSQITLNGSILPLENKIAALGPGSGDPDLMVFTLWSTGVNQNHLGAFYVPHPYDGSGVSFDQNIDVGALFGVGDLCVVGENQVVVPYIKANGGNFDVFVASFDGTQWSTAPIAATSVHDYHTTDCFITSNGIFLMVLNVTADRWEFYRSPLPTQIRRPYTWVLNDTLGEVELGDPPQDPFNPNGGIAVAESRMSIFVQGTFDSDFDLAAAMDGDLDGYLLIGRLDSNDIDGAYLPRNYDNNPSFEGAADLPLRRSRAPGDDILWVAIQEDDQLKLIRVGIDDPGLDQTVTLGPIGAGSLLSFQGIGVAEGPDGNVYALADKAFQVDPDLTVSQMTGYPFQGLGGPVNLVFPPGMVMGFAVGPGSQVLGILDVGALFFDGFETGDTSAWSFP